MRQNIKIQGMNTASEPVAGSAYNLVNLRDKNGALVPVSPRKKVLELHERYDYLFMHQMAAFGIHYLGVRSGGLYYIYHTATIAPFDKLLCSVGTNVQLSQIGNVINVTSTIGVQHVIWYQSDYVVIDTNFDGEQTDTVIGVCKVDLKVDSNPELRFYRGSEEYSSLLTEAELSAKGIAELPSLAIKARAQEAVDGRLTDYHTLITAVELYDGSYILHSNPIIIGQANDLHTRYENLDLTDYRGSFIANYKTNKGIFQGRRRSASSLTDGYILVNESYNALRPASTTEDGIGVPKIPNLQGVHTNFYNGTLFFNDYLYCVASSNVLKVKISSVITEQYRPLVKSLSIFMSRPTCMYDLNKTASYDGFANFNLGSGAIDACTNFLPYYKTNEEIIKELSENQLFYKVHEIPFDDLLVAGGWTEISLKGKIGENLVNQEQLPVDNFTHHSLVPVKQYVYNSRLHLLNYDQVLSHGFPYTYFEQTETGIGQFPTSFIAAGTSGTYPNIYSKGWVEVTIKTETGNSIVVRHVQYNYPRATWSYISMLSYPDARATQIKIHTAKKSLSPNSGDYGENTLVFKLTPSKEANFAYYINPDLKPISYVLSGVATEIYPPETNRSQTFQSGLKVSEVNNPFTFPLKNTYTIGNGKALNMASNAMRVSEGQFGQYPLYVFTEDGVYVLQIGTDVLYITQAPISTEQPISDKILPTPYGIVFITKKGLKLINGANVDFVSALLEQKRDTITLDKISISELNGAFMMNSEELYQFLTSNDLKLAYNPHETEILLNKGTDKIFCANLTSFQWYLSTEKWDNVVENSFPDLLVKKDTQTVSTIIDYESAETQTVGQVTSEVKTQCAFSLRGFDLGTNDYKRLRRAWIRGQIIAGTNIYVMLHGSLDNRSFRALKGISYAKASGSTNPSNDFKDIDLGMTTEKHKQYSLSLAMTCDSATKIDSIEIEIDKEYDNEKF